MRNLVFSSVFNYSLIRPIQITKKALMITTNWWSPIYCTSLAESQWMSCLMSHSHHCVELQRLSIELFQHAAVLLCCDSNVVVLQYFSPAAWCHSVRLNTSVLRQHSCVRKTDRISDVCISCTMNVFVWVRCVTLCKTISSELFGEVWRVTVRDVQYIGENITFGQYYNFFGWYYGDIRKR